MVKLAVQFDLNIPFAFIGNQPTIFSLSRYLCTEEVRKNQKMRVIWVHLDDPGCFGPKEESASNLTVQVLIITNAARVPTTRDHITLRQMGIPAEM